MRLIRTAARARASFAQRLLIFGVAVAGILVGLLAMHTMKSDRAHISAGVPSSAAAHQQTGHATLPAHEQPDEDCDGDCPVPVHDMLATACILALAITVLVVAVPITISAAHGTTTLPTPWRAHLAWPRPPSLHALSISRT
jgi:hypothetical protein